jgi:CheY-like chemotaxis protein
MSDATNFPLSNEEFRLNISSKFPCGAENSDYRNGRGESDTGTIPDELAAQNPPAIDAISSAAAEAARSIGPRNHARPEPVAAKPVRDRRRRRRRRALISAPVRVRCINATENGPDEIATTTDVSRGGILFATQSTSFHRDMELAVTFPFCNAPGTIQAEQLGRVARIHDLPDGRRAVAVAIGAGAGEDLVDSSGRKLDRNAVRVCISPNSDRPLVLAVDPDDMVRETLKHYLSNEGYTVIAVKNGADARKVLEMFTPALLIAEVEGADLPGYSLCAYVKSTPGLKKIPVLLTTRSGNPTDYSNAHSLGAVVCMAKPYKQERLGHVVRLLAPPPASLLTGTTPPRTPDLSRRFCPASPAKPATTNNGSKRFRFRSSR